MPFHTRPRRQHGDGRIGSTRCGCGCRQPHRAVAADGCEGAAWLGSRLVDAAHVFQDLGDGLRSSGSLAIRAAVADGCRMTFPLLYNRRQR